MRGKAERRERPKRGKGEKGNWRGEKRIAAAELCNGGSERSGTEAGRQDQDQSARRERECAEAGALEPVACVDSLSRAIGFFTSATAASPLSPPPASGAAGTQAYHAVRLPAPQSQAKQAKPHSNPDARGAHSLAWLSSWNVGTSTEAPALPHLRTKGPTALTTFRKRGSEGAGASARRTGGSEGAGSLTSKATGMSSGCARLARSPARSVGRSVGRSAVCHCGVYADKVLASIPCVWVWKTFPSRTTQLDACTHPIQSDSTRRNLPRRTSEWDGQVGAGESDDAHLPPEPSRLWNWKFFRACRSIRIRISIRFFPAAATCSARQVA